MTVSNVDLTSGGYVSLGWGPNGKMAGSDFFTAFYDGSTIKYKDYFCKSGHFMNEDKI